jgi:peroxiredoxin
MRKTLALLITAASLAGCAQKEPVRTITAKIGGGAGRMLYFDKFQGNKPVHVDSVMLDANGAGRLELARLPLDFYGLTLGDADMLVLVLDSAESVEVEATAGKFRAPEKVSGSAHSEALHGFFTEVREYNEEKEKLAARISADRTDTAAIARVTTINADLYDACKRIAEEHKSSPVALAAMNYMNIQQDLPLFTEVREALRRTIPRSEYFASFRDRVDRAEKELAAMKAQEEQMARMDNLIPVGSPAPDFTQPMPNDKPLSLSSFKGKVVLIDFWASWCKPCRMENPNVKKVYAKYHDKGFEILGVSLDRDKNAWTAAIQQDGLPWQHVSDLAFWNNAAAQQYGVNSIPYTVLVDREGKVMAKNLRGPALEEKLAEVFR